MGIITIKATPVSPFTAFTYTPPGTPLATNPSIGAAYNWVAQNNQLGDYDIGRVWVDLPGPYQGFDTNFLKPETTAAGTVTNPRLPNPIYAPMPGQIISAYEVTLGWGEFVCLRNPVSNALPVGTLVTWDATYNITTLPAKGTSKNSSDPVAVAVSSASVSSTSQSTQAGTIYPVTPLYDGSGLASQANQITIAWYQITGRAWTLKTNVQVTPNTAGYVSGTAGRIYGTASTGGAILGSRLATGTTTTTQSMVLAYYANRAQMQGT